MYVLLSQIDNQLPRKPPQIQMPLTLANNFRTVNWPKGIRQRFKGFYAAKKMGAALMGGGWKSKGTSPEWCDSAGNLKWHSCCMLHIEELAMNTLNFPLWHTRGLNANAPSFSYPFSQILADSFIFIIHNVKNPYKQQLLQSY